MSITMSMSMTEISNQVEDDFNAVFDGVKHQLKDTMESRTPVDSGRARAGWEIDGDDIVNNVPYIGYLEVGTQHNRPIGMMATALLEVEDIVKQNTLKVNV